MSNPVVVNITKNVWTKVATNVTTGFVNALIPAMKQKLLYLQTYRLTGGSAPTAKDEGVQIFNDTTSAVIQSSAGIDVYIMSIYENGEVRVDV